MDGCIDMFYMNIQENNLITSTVVQSVQYLNNVQYKKNKQRSLESAFHCP